MYITGRSSNERDCTEEGVGGSLEETRRLVEERGGSCVAVRCDHAKDEEVEELFRRVDAECGRLDVLVNNAFAGLSGVTCAPFTNFWDQGAQLWDACAGVGLRSHYVASCLAFPLLQKTARSTAGGGGCPLIVNVSSFGGLTFTFNVAYGVAKAALDRLSADMAVQLKPEGIATLSLWPGVVSTEKMNQVMADPSSFLEKTGMGLREELVESPLLVGRVLASLADDDAGTRLQRSGQVEVVAEVAASRGILDEGGKAPPPSIRSLKFILPAVVAPKLPEGLREALLGAPLPDWKLPFFIMKGGAPQ